ncbi:hypothetical protein BV22DRAFT_1121179 [Leucogyrophana mollusca]|uniref:Uncharacterized protein n=1 Tax=Leucogyrophana mollusca TaxID=85980 RepID=A0ACB8BAU1_9AGAM|nr:hypothetical protein BV22DRAFT_1121179 [Leucogyrophana mollusca]
MSSPVVGGRPVVRSTRTLMISDVSLHGDAENFVTTRLLRESFEFMSIAHQDLYPLAVYPSGVYLPVSVQAVSQLAEHFPFFAQRELLSVGREHGIDAKASDKRVWVLDTIRLHECTDKCKGVTYLFRNIPRCQRDASKPQLPEPIHRIAAIQALHKSIAVKPTSPASASIHSTLQHYIVGK